MDLTLYTELTGKTIPESQTAYYQALISRTQAKLESILGWSFTPVALYQEKGKTQRDCVCPDIPQSNLLPADEVKGIIKVFPYNWKDKFLHIDPFTQVYAAKLVKVLNNREFITFKTFENFTQQMMANGIGRYIERCKTCYCDCNCKDCVQLAVDANWLSVPTEDDQPADLLYLWCDMIDYYGDPARDISSESVDGHSWSKGKDALIAPEATDAALVILKKYAGPFGLVDRIPTL